MINRSGRQFDVKSIDVELIGIDEEEGQRAHLRIGVPLGDSGENAYIEREIALSEEQYNHLFLTYGPALGEGRAVRFRMLGLLPLDFKRGIIKECVG